MRDRPVWDLYRDGGLPIPITLGALIVFDAAERSQDRGRRWGDVLDDAITAAKFLDLVTVVRDITHSLDHCGEACPICQHEGPADRFAFASFAARMGPSLGRTTGSGGSHVSNSPQTAVDHLLTIRSHQ